MFQISISFPIITWILSVSTWQTLQRTWFQCHTIRKKRRLFLYPKSIFHGRKYSYCRLVFLLAVPVMPFGTRVRLWSPPLVRSYAGHHAAWNEILIAFTSSISVSGRGVWFCRVAPLFAVIHFHAWFKTKNAIDQVSRIPIKKILIRKFATA